LQDYQTNFWKRKVNCQNEDAFYEIRNGFSVFLSLVHLTIRNLIMTWLSICHVKSTIYRTQKDIDYYKLWSMSFWVLYIVDLMWQILSHIKSTIYRTRKDIDYYKS
jgi:hypothetical protein